MTGQGALPHGYVRFSVAAADVVAQEREAAGVADLLLNGPIHARAGAMAGARRYEGRSPAYGIALPRTGSPVVVRHATHGGLLAPLTRDLFFGAGRAPHELAVSEHLRHLGVLTPRVIAYARYGVVPSLHRCDVLTAEVGGAQDLAAALRDDPEPRRHLEAAAALLASLARAGARHADINIKNVVVVSEGQSITAWALDVDRVTLGVAPGRAMDANLGRFTHSARRWMARGAIAVSEHDLCWFAERVRELAA